MAVLDDVKKSLGITGNYQNDTLTQYIDEVKEFLKDAGVKESDISSGVIARGVADLWNYGAGEAKFSDYFIMRATQLALQNPNQDIPTAEPEYF